MSAAETEAERKMRFLYAIRSHGVTDPRVLTALEKTDLEHLVARPRRQGLGHQPDDRGLADGLAAGDGQRHVLIGAVGEDALDEGAAVGLLSAVSTPGSVTAFGREA